MLSLLDVAALCARMRAAELDLFEQLGSWVTDTPPGAEQRRWAAACHRHAWHAQLWAERAPAIRPFDLAVAVAESRGSMQPPSGDRAGWYATTLAELSVELDTAAQRIDPELDPSTVRTITLVRTDLAMMAR